MYAILAVAAVAGAWEPPAYRPPFDPPAYHAPAEDVPEIPDSAPVPEGRELILIYTGSCVHCSAALGNAWKSGISVRAMKAEDNVEEAINLWRDCVTEFGPPAWVLVEDGKVLKRWIGVSSPKGVRQMANYRPPAPETAPAVATRRTTYRPPATYYYAPPVAYGACLNGRCR